MNNFNKYRQLMIKELKKYQELLIDELKNNVDKINESNIYIVGSQGIKLKENDRRDYLWIKVMFKKYEYWLTLFYNEVDLVTGNPHTQIGRLQFWKNIINHTPNDYIVENDLVYWYLNSKNSSEPKRGMTHVGFEDYNLIVDDFIEFINNDIKIKKTIKRYDMTFH